MKMKSLIKLVVILLVVAIGTVLAFVGPKIGTLKFNRVDKAIDAGDDIGLRYFIDYKVTAAAAEPEASAEPTAEATAEPTAEATDDPAATEAPAGEETETVEEATAEPTAEPTTAPTEAPTAEPTAAPTATPTPAPTEEDKAEAVRLTDVFQKRLAAVTDFNGLLAKKVRVSDVTVRQIGDNMVRVEMPYAYLSIGDMLNYPGVISISCGDMHLNNDSIRSVKVAYDYDSSAFIATVKLNEDGKAAVADATASGTGTIDVKMDTTAEKDSGIAGTCRFTEPITNGKLKVSFTEFSNAFAFGVCANSGCYVSDVAMQTSGITDGTAGNNINLIFAIVAAALMLLCAVYLILAHKGMGIAATLSVYIGVLLLVFFAVAFSWMQVNMVTMAGLGIAFLLILEAHRITLQEIGIKYAFGKDIVSAVDTGVRDAYRKVALFMGVTAVTGIALWFFGAVISGVNMAYFGMALLGGSVIGFVTGTLFVKILVKIFIGLGIDSAKALGLKRGE